MARNKMPVKGSASQRRREVFSAATQARHVFIEVGCWIVALHLVTGGAARERGMAPGAGQRPAWRAQAGRRRARRSGPGAPAPQRQVEVR